MILASTQQRPRPLAGPKRPLRATLLLALTALGISSCGPYRFANDSAQPGRAVEVETIAAPAELGLNTPALRAVLSDQIFNRGLGVSPRAAYRVRCTVGAHRTTGFDDDLVSEVDVRCPLFFKGALIEVVEAIGVSADALATDLEPALAALEAVSRAEELAVADALSQIATRVAYLVDQHHRSETSP